MVIKTARGFKVKLRGKIVGVYETHEEAVEVDSRKTKSRSRKSEKYKEKTRVIVLCSDIENLILHESFDK